MVTRPTTSSERIKRLLKQYNKWEPAVCIERDLAWLEAWRENEAQPVVIKTALGLKRFCETKTILIQSDELIVGDPARQPKAMSTASDWSLWYEGELDTIESRPQDPFHITEEQKKILRAEVFPFWRGRTSEDISLALHPEEIKTVHATRAINVLYHASAQTFKYGPDMTIMLEKGFNGIKAEAEERLRSLDLTNPEDSKKVPFLRAITIVCDAMGILGRRHAEEARRLAEKTEDPDRKTELLKIADICDWVPANPARTFHEALQAIYFYVATTHNEESIPSTALGRMDRYLYPYYNKDLEEGRITKEEAQELLDSLWIKFSEIFQLKEGRYAQVVAGYNPFLQLNVGGLDPNGEPVANDLSYMMLQSSINTKLFQPTITILIDKKTPESLLLKACELSSTGVGHPSFFSNETTMKILLDLGVPMIEARNGGVYGCVSPFLPGKWAHFGGGLLVELAHVIEFALNDGVCRWGPFVGKQIGIKTGDPRKFTSYEQVLLATREQMEYLVKLCVTASLINERVSEEYRPLPLLSALCHGCVQNGWDISSYSSGKGLEYNIGNALFIAGLADYADSLAAVKKLVFDEKKITMTELCDALDNNFEGDGYDRLRLQLLTAPKYGNDDDYVDSIARDTVLWFYNESHKYKCSAGTPFQVNCIPLSTNVSFGSMTGALPSGRKAGEPVADGISPQAGMDKKGPTAVIRSISKICPALLTCGSILNMKFEPSLLETEEGMRNFASLIRTLHHDLGGFHIQFNVVSEETLRDAQKYPEKYQNLMVRVAGYSAYFVTLWKPVQDHIIARTAHKQW